MSTFSKFEEIGELRAFKLASSEEIIAQVNRERGDRWEIYGAMIVIRHFSPVITQNHVFLQPWSYLVSEEGFMEISKKHVLADFDPAPGISERYSALWNKFAELRQLFFGTDEEREEAKELLTPAVQAQVYDNIMNTPELFEGVQEEDDEVEDDGDEKDPTGQPKKYVN